MIYEYSFEDNEILYITDKAAELKLLLDSGKYAIPLYQDGNYDTDAEGNSWPFCDYAVSNLAEVPKEDLHKIYLRLAEKPITILITPHLLVREMTVDDVDDFYRIYSGEGICDYIEPLFEDPENERLYTRNYIRDIYKFYDYGLWTVIDKETDKIIGRAGISNRDGFDIPELGFVIENEYQGKGLGYEVCLAILDYAKKELGFTKIQALVKPQNHISINLLKKLNFRETDEVFDGYNIMYYTC